MKVALQYNNTFFRRNCSNKKIDILTSLNSLQFLIDSHLYYTQNYWTVLAS